MADHPATRSPGADCAVLIPEIGATTEAGCNTRGVLDGVAANVGLVDALIVRVERLPVGAPARRGTPIALDGGAAILIEPWDVVGIE
mmetsp:Transcript_32636/g.58953  ORF Transcript_32636/g.58953 Transcript_32636/m.58953 type:complete len:87 (-) Transcript_32636:72-332(-)